jgi:hypothetical protein
MRCRDFSCKIVYLVNDKWVINDFKRLHQKNLGILQSKNFAVAHENKKGVHPALGEVTLYQLLSAWVIHDLNQINQITRVMAKQYKEEVGSVG